MQAGAQMVKLEGGGWTAPIVRMLVERGIPVCAHLGFTPQSVHALGGYRIQGARGGGGRLLAAPSSGIGARRGADAGPRARALGRWRASVTAGLSIPVIGIGAGTGCSGQVLVLHDMLDITHGKLPRFVRNFCGRRERSRTPVGRIVRDVKNGAFPDDASTATELGSPCNHS